MKMKGKLLMVGLVLIAILSAGCLNLTVYDTYEEVTPTATDYSGTVDDYSLMDGGSGGSGRFPSGTDGQVLFRNSYDPVTKTAESSSFSVVMDYSDVTDDGIAGELSARIMTDSGSFEYYDFTNIVDYDGYWHLSGFYPTNDFSYYDSNGDGIIEVFLIHDASDANSIRVQSVFIQVDFTTSTETPSTNTGSVEFYTDPTGASVHVDGIYKGTTSAYSYAALTVSDLSAGSHTWSISKTGYTTESGTVNVVAGSVVSIIESLEAVEEPAGDGDTPEGTTNIPPTAKISMVQPSKSLVVFNSDQSTDPDGTIVKREWKLNGKVEISAVQYQFSTSDKSAGTYTVQLTVTDNDGATGSAQYDITIKENAITNTEAVEEPAGADDEDTPEGTDDKETEGTTFVIPGFEALFALIGLILVSWHVRRNEP